jgi:glutamyl-tRNA reductase
MKIVNIGMNHESAPVDLRERLAVKPEGDTSLFDRLKGIGLVKELFFLSTCNRIETLFITEAPQQAKESVISLMSRHGDIPEEVLSTNLYMLEDMDAVRHIFRVASSLDSMVVGEPQILGQLKNAYSEAVRHKASGVILNRLMHRAFHVAKRVRTETGICTAAVSISYAAVELAKKIFYSLEGKKVLLIGAGEMSELTARHLMAQGVSSMAVANRTFERAVEVSRLFDASPVSFGEIDFHLIEADIVVTSTGSPYYVITCEQVKKCLRERRNRPIFFIDIAVPRDVEPEVNVLSNVYVYDIDDLKGVIQVNIDQRRQEAIKAERIVEEEVIKFEKWLKTLAVVPTIVSLRDKAESIIQAELRKSNPALSCLPSIEKDAIQKLIRSIVEKLLNDPIVFLKKKADRPSLNGYLDVTRKLFGLDGEDNNGEK